MSVNNLKYSKAGADLTKSFEQCPLTAYWDALGKVWTIGWGHTGPEVCEGLVWTQEQADAALANDYAGCEASVNQCVTVPLTQGEFDALVDIEFNVGRGAIEKSTLLKLLNAGDRAGAAAQFPEWDHAGGKVVVGLLRRRQAEEQEFLAIDPEISN